MIIQLLLANIADFTVFVIGALVFFAAGLLFFDSWILNRKKNTVLLRSIGFFLLALVLASYASAANNQLIVSGAQVVKIIGLGLVMASLVLEPILGKPGAKEKVSVKTLIPLLPMGVFMPILPVGVFIPVSALLSFLIFGWYLIRSTKGMDKQLKPAAVAFFFLSLAELLKIAFSFADTTNVFWSQMLALHGLLWNIYLGLMLIGFLILGVWIWGYIRFRLQLQIFSIILTSVFLIFIATTSLFSFLLIKNLEADALSHLTTDAQVFQYALEQLQMQSLSNGRSVATNSDIQKALENNNRQNLYQVSSELLLKEKLSSLIIASSSGQVIMRAEDKDNYGDSLESDPLVRQALTNQEISSLVSSAHPITPQVFVKSAVPITSSDDKMEGVAIVGLTIDNAFVDGVKNVTGLDVTVFADTSRTATTLIAPDGKSRFLGTQEADSQITQQVIQEKSKYLGQANILGESYYAAYSPLLAYGGEAIGMLFIGKPQVSLLALAQESINLTFLGSTILMAFAIIPAYFLSRYIREQLEA